ncbi:nitronate monooxygenase family protein [Desulfosarcina sp. OttesenSCG-928-G17]|nr:nitronate monooxygenase family protein [Desulfosarcina sp. OttesenSCG-928-G17]
MWNTRVTEKLGITLPIIGGAMQWLGRAPFVAAISNAGALGIITSASFTSKDELKDEIRKTRDLTDKPFAVNINLFPSMRPFSIDDMLDAVDEESVGIVETAGRSPEPYMARLKQGGRIHLHKCARRKDAIKAEALGVDMVTIVGTECGGHPAYEGVSTFVLLPRTVDAVTIPVIGGGGIYDGRGLMAAFALGAEAVVIGTGLMATTECPLHENFKQALIQAEETSTCKLLDSVKAPMRTFLNQPAKDILDMEAHGKSLEEILPRMRGELGRDAYQTGDINGCIWACGQSAGLIQDSVSVKTYFQRIIKEAETIQKQWQMP